jgi:hypothetical protein
VRRWLQLSAAFLSLFMVLFLPGSACTWTGFGFDASGRNTSVDRHLEQARCESAPAFAIRGETGIQPLEA